MRVSCLLNQRRLTSYLDGEVSTRKARLLEDHLALCGRCREEYVRLRSARAFARQLPKRAPARDIWPALKTAISSVRESEDQPGQKLSAPRASVNERLKGALIRPSVVSILTAVVGLLMMGIGLFLALGRTAQKPPDRSDMILGRIDTNNFRMVPIDQIKDSSDPHIVAEGYVTDLNVDQQDGDLTFRLISDPRQPQSFVVCEIIDSIKVKPPHPGSRIRVYGVSRYDAQAGHNWYEVHPVLGIEPATR